MKLKTFPDDAATQLISYATGRASLFRKRVKSVVFGPGVPTGKSAKTKHYGPLMESNLSDKGNMHTENQKELMARSYLEIVRNFIFLLKFMLRSHCSIKRPRIWLKHCRLLYGYDYVSLKRMKRVLRSEQMMRDSLLKKSRAMFSLSLFLKNGIAKLIKTRFSKGYCTARMRKSLKS